MGFRIAALTSFSQSHLVAKESEKRGNDVGVTKYHKKFKDFLVDGRVNYSDFIPFVGAERITSVLTQAHAKCAAEINEDTETAPAASPGQEAAVVDAVAWKMAFSVLTMATALLITVFLAMTLKLKRTQHNANLRTGPSFRENGDDEEGIVRPVRSNLLLAEKALSYKSSLHRGKNYDWIHCNLLCQVL